MTASLAAAASAAAVPARRLMARGTRLLLAGGSLALGLLYLTPLWRIGLRAPQYPEGLGLRIWINRITGAAPQDLESINNLNHYIGMRRIVPESIPELRYLPWILAGLIGAGLLVALLGRRTLLYAWLAVFAAGAVAGLGDLWKWGYDYGHQLDPRAIIQIPGMSYQPPLIGGKQLLNFHASSWPGTGGWIAIAVLLLTLWIAIAERRRDRRIAEP